MADEKRGGNPGGANRGGPNRGGPGGGPGGGPLGGGNGMPLLMVESMGRGISLVSTISLQYWQSRTVDRQQRRWIGTEYLHRCRSIGSR